MKLSPEQVYAQIIVSTPSNLEEKVLGFFQENPGKDISREELFEHVFGVRLPAGTDVTILKEDRQIRRAIVKLRKKNYPIVASSGRGGYQWAVSAEPIIEMIRENKSRIAKLRENNRKLTSIARSQFGGMIELPGIR